MIPGVKVTGSSVPQQREVAGETRLPMSLDPNLAPSRETSLYFTSPEDYFWLQKDADLLCMYRKRIRAAVMVSDVIPRSILCWC